MRLGGRRGLYIGGEQYFAQLDAALSAEAAQPVLISGEAGLGKSALIATWLHRWRAQHPEIPVILHHLSAGRSRRPDAPGASTGGGGCGDHRSTL